MFETATHVEGYYDGYHTEVEDRAEVIPLDDGATLVLVVADGAGGRAGGAWAADVAVQQVRAWATDRHRVGEINERALCRLLLDVDRALVDDPSAGETTAVVAAVSPLGVVGASVGDSGAWQITPTGWDDLTEQQRKPMLGTGEAFPVAFKTGPLRGTLLVASDGLWKYADAPAVCQTARHSPLGDAAARLLDLVRLCSGGLHDDVSVVLCRIATVAGNQKFDGV